MVKLTKTPLPAGIKITSDNDYRNGVVFDTLVEDCHCKCYICEDKTTDINVEHIVPHRSDVALRYDWNNLFLACGHCNNTVPITKLGTVRAEYRLVKMRINN